MKTKTQKKRKYIGNTSVRAGHAWEGCFKILKLLERAEGTENVSNIVASNEARILLQHMKGNF